jgi:dTDP-4-amino-4,6-dideoxygalactose transaminase
MTVPLLDLKAQLRSIREEVVAAVTEVVDSGCYVMGPKVEQLEKEVAAHSGTTDAIGVSSGTDALLISLMALDVGPGDLVLTTPYSFFATAGVVTRLGATPVFVDIDPESFNMCPRELEKWLLANPKKREDLKAIIPIHLYGQCAEMESICDIASQYSIPVIEDAAQALGARYTFKGVERRAGSMGLMGCFSFFPSKNLGGIGDGGMVVTSDKALAEKLRMLRTHGAKPKYYHSLVGGNFRLDPIQAAVLSVKLPHLDSWNDARRKNALYYEARFSSADITKPVLKVEAHQHIYNQYVLKVSDRRDALRDALKEKGIGNEVYYPVPFHLQECFRYLGLKKGDYPHSEYCAEHSIAIPIYPELSDEQKDIVVMTIEEFYAKSGSLSAANA